MGEGDPLQPNGEPNIYRADDVLDLKIDVTRRLESHPLQDVRDLLRREAGIVTALRARDDELPGREDEGGRPGLAKAHDHGGEATGVELGVAAAEGDLLQIETYSQVGCFLGIDAVRRREVSNANYR